ncbi:hypothetical protein CR513_45814, partial [Mucuna pruriens]
MEVASSRETIIEAMETEGHIVNRPPLFKGQNYSYCKQRMMEFFIVCHIDMWDVVENDNYIPTNKEGAKTPRSSWNGEQKTRNFLMYALTKSKYEEVYNSKLSEEMWDTLALAYEGMSQVRDYTISMLVDKYELFKMEDNKTIYLMFGRFKIIVYNLRSLGKTYANYDHITKILRILRASKDLKKLPMEELLGMLKAPKGLTSKAFKAKESFGDTSHEDCFDEDELSFISKKIQSIWKHKKGSRWKNNFRKHTKETKDQMQVVSYEFKKPRHFKFECPNLENKKKPFIKQMKSLITTWKDFDLSSSKDENEEPKLYLIFGCRSYDCRERPKGLYKSSRTNPKGPMTICVPKTMITPVVNVFNNSKKTP